MQQISMELQAWPRGIVPQNHRGGGLITSSLPFQAEGRKKMKPKAENPVGWMSDASFLEYFDVFMILPQG